jgi:hypothetical protein
VSTDENYDYLNQTKASYNTAYKHGTEVATVFQCAYGSLSHIFTG